MRRKYSGIFILMKKVLKTLFGISNLVRTERFYFGPFWNSKFSVALQVFRLSCSFGTESLCEVVISPFFQLRLVTHSHRQSSLTDENEGFSVLDRLFSVTGFLVSPLKSSFLETKFFHLNSEKDIPLMVANWNLVDNRRSLTYILTRSFC